MYLWLDQREVASVGHKMDGIFAINTQRKLFTFWRTLKSRRNQKRLRVHLIRSQLNQRPELARPLLAIKNMLMFKAFNKLFEGSK